MSFLKFDIIEISTSFMVLFVVIDIVGNIPNVIVLRQKSGKIDSGKASLIAGGIFILFLSIGEKLLQFIGVDVYSFAVAGAFILFFIAMEMILGITFYKEDSSQKVNSSIFPIAFPLFAGPGSLTTLLSLRAEFKVQNIIVGIILNVLLIYIVLKLCKKIEKVIGSNGIQVIRKIFGIILLAICIKLFTTNIKGLL